MSIGDALSICIMSVVSAIVYMDGNLGYLGSWVLLGTVSALIYAIIERDDVDDDEY